MDQRTDEWYQARLSKCTASRISDVLAKIKYGEAATRRNYKIQLVTERLTNMKSEDSFMSVAMQNGIDREPIARQLFSERTGNIVTEVGFIDHPNIPYSGCSPDGVIESENSILELKCPMDSTMVDIWMNQQVPSKWLPQIMFQLSVTGAKFCHFAAYSPNFPENLQLYIQKVERDEDQIALINTEVQLFLQEVEDIVNKLKGVKHGNTI
jgi:putative phage-type endonuclease